jgi:hypothetical protein
MLPVRRACAIAVVIAGAPLLGLLAKTSAQDQAREPVPAFHNSPPTGTIPPVLDGAQFPQPVVQNAYRTAAKIKKTLYQQPCYCHCDRSQGHGSLADCFASRHGSGCNVCMAEVFYASEQLKKGKTAAQIREGIIKGEWQDVDLSKYNQAPGAKPAE